MLLLLLLYFNVCYLQNSSGLTVLGQTSHLGWQREEKKITNHQLHLEIFKTFEQETSKSLRRPKGAKTEELGTESCFSSPFPWTFDLLKSEIL